LLVRATEVYAVDRWHWLLLNRGVQDAVRWLENDTFNRHNLSAIQFDYSDYKVAGRYSSLDDIAAELLRQGRGVGAPGTNLELGQGPPVVLINSIWLLVRSWWREMVRSPRFSPNFAWGGRKAMHSRTEYGEPADWNPAARLFFFTVWWVDRGYSVNNCYWKHDEMRKRYPAR